MLVFQEFTTFTPFLRFFHRFIRSSRSTRLVSILSHFFFGVLVDKFFRYFWIFSSCSFFCRFLTFSLGFVRFRYYVVREVFVQKYELRLTIRMMSCRKGRTQSIACTFFFEEFTAFTVECGPRDRLLLAG